MLASKVVIIHQVKAMPLTSLMPFADQSRWKLQVKLPRIYIGLARGFSLNNILQGIKPVHLPTVLHEDGLEVNHQTSNPYASSSSKNSTRMPF